MRLRERDKQTVVLREPAGMDDEGTTWGAATAIRAAVYPAGERLDRRVYGERVERMRLMLYDGAVRLRPGMGVALCGDVPQYRIESVEAWSHQRALLAGLSEGRRGVDGGA